MIFFFVGTFLWFRYYNDSLIECLWEYYFLFSLLEEREKDWCKFFVCLVEFACEATWSWTFFCRVFFCLVTDSISFLVIALFKLYISSWLNFGQLYVSRKCPFFLGCQICWHIIDYSFLLWFFFFVSMQYQLIFYFSFIILFTWVLSLFFLVAWPEVCQFCLPFQRTSSLFYCFSFLFLKLYLLLLRSLFSSFCQIWVLFAIL